MAWSYNDETEVYTVAFSELNDLLSSLSDNTSDTAYKLEITGLTASDLVYNTTTHISPIANVLWTNNDTKYVDLSPTTLPNTTTVYGTFSGVQTLVEPPVLPSNVTNMYGCFYLCVKMKHAPTIPANVTNMESCFQDCRSITVAPTIPSRVTTLKNCFYNCFALTETPTIPTSVTTIESCFNGCRALTTVTNIPQQTTNIKEAFYGCTALKTIYNWRYNSISTNNNYSGDCFTDCNALEQIFIDEYNNSRRSNLVTFLTNRQTNGFFPSDKTVVNMVFYPYTEGFSIASSNLDNYLTYIPQNTASNPYKLTITGLSVNNVRESTTSGTLGYIIKNRARFLDLSLTTLNASQTTMKQRFKGCATLVVPPVIPVNVTDMEECFYGCESLINTPDMSFNTKVTTLENCFVDCFSLIQVILLPPNVTTLYGAFNGCDSLVDFTPTIPETVTDMEECFANCSALKNISKLPSSVTNLSHCFEWCSALEVSPIIPRSVTNMEYAFAHCISLKVAPVIPDSVENLYVCFGYCTSLVNAPSLPKGDSQFDDFTGMFYGCSSLKRVNFNGTFDLTLADFDSAFNDCDMLESVFVKSRENQVALITYLESQQNDGKFPSGLNVSEIVKFGEKIMKVQTEEGTEIVDLYRFKEQLLTEKNGELVYADEDFKPFSVQIDNETFFAQTIPESLLSTCRNKGSGTVLKKKVGTEIIEGVTTPVYQWFTKSAGTLEEPFQKKYTELDVYTEDESGIELDPADFPKGGVILIYGGAGESRYRASQNDGGKGGVGQIKRIEIPANMKGTAVLSVSFAKTSTDGTISSYTKREYYSEKQGQYWVCSYKNSTQYGSVGGVGGKNCTAVFTRNGVTETLTAYGGGGGGGTWVDIWSGYTGASGNSCNNYKSYSGSATTGGASGNPTPNPNINSNGGDATDGSDCAPNTSTVAKLVIGAYV